MMCDAINWFAVWMAVSIGFTLGFLICAWFIKDDGLE